MKKYSLTWVQLNSRRLTRATRPKPFPGKYPTRIAWQATTTTGRSISYIGKPTTRIIRQFRGLLAHFVFRKIWAVEFDKNGAIARITHGNQYDRTCDAIAPLRKLYHSLQDVNQFFSRDGTWKPMLRDGKAFQVFWPNAEPRGE